MKRDINWYIKGNNIPLDVTALNCYGVGLTSLNGIEKLTKLTSLFCFNNNLASLHGIEKLNNLTRLYCYNNKLTNLNGIEKLTNLTTIYCSDNKLPYSSSNKLEDILPELKNEIRNKKLTELGI